ncbi:MAG: Txe/YoeB family addiction module toxin [Meiothermus sp.]
MRLIFSEEAWEDYLYWQKTDKALLRRINELIRDAQRNAFDGLGKPELLKPNLQGWWSRRINQEHRMVYKVEGNDLIIAMLRYHHED